MRKAVKRDEQYFKVVSNVSPKSDANVVAQVQHTAKHGKRSKRNPATPCKYGAGIAETNKCCHGNEK